MSDHLPECPMKQDCGELDARHTSETACQDCGRSCSCPELRACEQRVLDAAREAVVAAYAKDSLAVRSQTEWGIEIALAAIDALKRERSENPDTPPSAENPDNPLTCGECQTEIGLDDVGCLHLADDDDHGHIGTLAAIDALRKENR